MSTLALCLVALLAARAAADDPRIRLRLEWGGGEARRWQGTVRVSEGSVADPRPLGVEADEPGSMWIEEGILQIQQRSSRVYDGLDLLVSAPEDASLIVDLWHVDEDLEADPRSQPEETEIPLTRLVAEYHSSPLDRHNNRLLARRSPGDKLRVNVLAESLVGLPGQDLELEIEPCLVGMEVSGPLRLEVRCLRGRSSHEVWSDSHDITLDEQGCLATGELFKVPLPEEEGVYDLVVALTRRMRPNRLSWKQTIEERRVQVVVVDPTPSSAAPSGKDALGPKSVVLEIDPAKPGWWQRLPHLPLLPTLAKGPLSNGEVDRWDHALGKLVQLPARGPSADIRWEAYPLPISNVREPHILEVEYPSNVPQSLGISILEPNAAGALLPVGLDSGLYLPDDAADSAPLLARHRLVFWPRTKSPLLLFTNLGEKGPAAFGKIRVLGKKSPPGLSDLGWKSTQALHLPPAYAALDGGARLVAGYYDRPLFPENFSASEALDTWSGRSLDDWQTFHEGGTRLVEYLRYAGQNGLMLSVLADGSAIYPSRLLESTPRYDTGAFFASGQDALRKDVLEMLFRLFDRAGLKLIPAVHFSAPLAELEAWRRAHPDENLELVGADAQRWLDKNSPRRGLAPYYNPLHPRVQQAMRGVLMELAQRYHQHASFGGLAVVLSAEGYAQLPGAEWGQDEETLARFQQETGTRLDSGRQRPGDRAKRLAGKHRTIWLEWRARTLARSYHEMQQALAAIHPPMRLYLAGANLLDNPELQRELRPSLPRAATLEDALLAVGIDAKQFKSTPGVVLLRPRRIAALDSLSSQALNLELNQAPELDQAARDQSLPGSVFFHEPRQERLESFDAQSPFKKSFTWLVTQSAPAGMENRRRFVHALATLDARAMFDGGWLLPLGQEEELRHPLAVYRQLPDVAFETLSDSRQPVTIRTHRDASRTIVYLANDSPWRVTVHCEVDGSSDCQVEALPGTGQVAGLTRTKSGLHWKVEVAPFDVVGATFSDPSVRLLAPRTTLPGSVAPRLAARIRDLWARAAVLQNPPALDSIPNANFEETSEGEGLAQWEVGAGTCRLDEDDPHGDLRSAKLTADEQGAWMESRPFDAPRTGRLSLLAWLRVRDVDRQPALRLSLEGTLDGQPYRRTAPIGQGKKVEKIGAGWVPVEFQFLDLPVEGLSTLQLRFELTGAGEVWIDDLQLRDLKFSDKELRELSKTLLLAQFKLDKAAFSDCLGLLEGYWPRYLVSNVELSPEAIMATQQEPPAESKPRPEMPAAKPGMLDRVRRLLPDFLR